ncbi:hypothetical protein A2Y83_03910 [Candidatus Falkowbacteria bacterium RBG_13_39_14]|uniref:Nudix hydrolase domain-containing protein n=1 Tax=Candidatus Falkowbacteria bacterium RBG_13_39_14 TaxID=1797985 RepID=A0A1F5S7Q6_9BACT|nr:MAG: hypothetical protein A2Y83_03910 [Candidatus Falkowbacteria bacterium RBG_13_39_14]
MTKQHFKITPSSYIILVRDNKILMQRRRNTGYEDGKYSVPAGHFEGGENATMTIIREAKEEIGIILDARNLKMVHIMNRSDKGNERVDFFFFADFWQGEIKNMEPEKCDELRWFDINSLPTDIIPFIAAGIENYKNKIFYSEFGW